MPELLSLVWSAIFATLDRTISSADRSRVTECRVACSPNRRPVRWAHDPKDQVAKAEFYPGVDKRQLFRDGYIASQSGHTRGSTVDLTLGRADGGELDMGTPFDFFSPKSWTANSNVTADQHANRMLLSAAMQRRGFRPYAKEWWHFTLRNEPFPETYFDFPVQ